MKKLLVILLMVVVLVIGAAIAVPFLVPTDTYKQQLIAQVQKATGRELQVAGPLKLSILPRIAVEMSGVQLANAPNSEPPAMVGLDQAEVELKVLPLLRGAVEVERFILTRPQIHLEIAADGRPNWQFGESQPATETDGSTGGGTSLPITELKLGEIRIVDGALTYADRRSGQIERLDEINLELNLPDIRSPLAANGSLGYKGETVALQLGLADPYAVLQGGSSAAEIAVNGTPLQLDFKGTVANGPEPEVAGPVELTVPSVRALAGWLASPIELAGDGLQKLSIAGELAGSPSRVAFTGAMIGLDQIQGQGEVTIDLAGPTPAVAGRLDLGAVDLNPYLPPETPAATPEQPAEGTGGTPGGTGEAAAAEGWSDEPIQFPAIGGADVAFELTLQALTVRDLKLDRTVLALDLQGTTMTATLKEFGLYGGRGNGVLTLALADGRPTVAQKVELAGLQALPFLRAAAGFERIEGTVSANLDVTSTGQSQKALVENLDGSGRVVFADGAITGINIAAMVRNVGAAFLDPAAGETRKTDFAELSGSFAIADGIVDNRDMTLQAPTLRVNGAGTVDLPARRLNYRIEPKAAATLEGQGGQQDVAGLLVPVMITGPWDNLSFAPDLRGVLQDALKDPAKVKEQLEAIGQSPEQVRQQLKKLEDDLKAGGTENLIKGLGNALGGQPAKEGAAPTSTEDAAKSLLKGLLGR
jgi:AsmA protein